MSQVIFSIGGAFQVKRWFTDQGQDVWNTVQWERRDVEIKDSSGKVIFSQKGVECPKTWSMNAITIVASKYFRGHDAAREKSVKELVGRVVGALLSHAQKAGYGFCTEEDAAAFKDELIYMLIHQMFAFNSPVWFNLGATKDPQCSACFILDVEDNMESILNWYREEGLVFQKGSGSGINISKIREKNARLTGGGHASGPLSFALAADRSAGTIKSGGKTRRAAKMLVMDVDHPDIFDFIETKVNGEKVARALIKDGFSSEFNAEGGAYDLAPWQNANNSVRVTNEFMKAVEEKSLFALRSRDPDPKGPDVGSMDAASLWSQIAEAAWSCGDPGVQFHDTVNEWHTCKASGEIVASNPCSEYMFLNNTSCNLASFNLLKFCEPKTFNHQSFQAACEYVTLAMELIVDLAGYPTETITKESKKYRTLGVGYANLGAMLMRDGLPYDCEQARARCAAITSLMTASVYAASAKIAQVRSPFAAFDKNRESMLEVIEKHAVAATAFEVVQHDTKEVRNCASQVWALANAWGRGIGFRNAQATVLAPTGTISFMMDCDTTGIEPDLALVKYKKLVGGGSIKIVNQSVRVALKESLFYTEQQTEDIIKYIEENDTIEGAPHLKPSDLPVFDCSLKPSKGSRYIQPMGHVMMMAAAQPFISGAISKTVNLPKEATVQDVEQIYHEAWKLGLKAIAVYRDGCKESQPLNVTEEKSKPDTQDFTVTYIAKTPMREKLPKERASVTRKFSIGGQEGYLTWGMYPDGRLGEIFVRMSKQGSTLGGLLDAWATMVSIALQHKIPLEELVEKFQFSRFEPSGFTGDEIVPSASSVIDYVVRLLQAKFNTYGKEKVEAEHNPVLDKMVPVGSGVRRESQVSGPACSKCGSMTVRAGACFKCNNCGETTGCG